MATEIKSLNVIELSDEQKEKLEKINPNLIDELYVTAEIAHTGFVNGNYYFYDNDAAKKAVKTLTDPYPKPVLIHHMEYADPVGRVVEASWEPTDGDGASTPTGVVKAKLKITDKDAIKKVLDGRYFTLSTRAMAGKVKCSICGEHPLSDKCFHIRGEKYDGKTCYWIIDEYRYAEVSFVNIPSDMYTKITSAEPVTTETSDNIDTHFATVELIDFKMHETKTDQGGDKNMSKNTKSSGSLTTDDDANNNNKEDSMQEVVDTYKGLIDELRNINAALKDQLETERARIAELEDKLVKAEDSIKEKEAEAKKLADELEAYKKETESVISTAKSVLVDKLVALKMELGMQVSDEERKNYMALDFAALNAVVGELESLHQAKNLTDDEKGDENPEGDGIDEPFEWFKA